MSVGDAANAKIRSANLDSGFTSFTSIQIVLSSCMTPLILLNKRCWWFCRQTSSDRHLEILLRRSFASLASVSLKSTRKESHGQRTRQKLRETRPARVPQQFGQFPIRTRELSLTWTRSCCQSTVVEQHFHWVRMSTRIWCKMQRKTNLRGLDVHHVQNGTHGRIINGKLFIEILSNGLFHTRGLSMTMGFASMYISRLIVLSRSHNLLHPLCFILSMLERLCVA